MYAWHVSVFNGNSEDKASTGTLTRTEFPHSFMIVTFGVICAAGESLSTLFLFTAKRKQLCQNLGMENVMSEKLQPPHSILNKWKVCASSPRGQGYLCDTQLSPGRGLTNLSKEFVFHSNGPRTEASFYAEYRWLKRKTEELEKEEEEADNCLNRKSYFFSRFQISTSTWLVHQGLNWATVSVPETCWVIKGLWEPR